MFHSFRKDSIGYVESVERIGEKVPRHLPERAMSQGFNDEVPTSFGGPHRFGPMMQAEWNIRGNDSVPLPSYPFFDMGVLENVQITWNVYVLDNFRTHKQIVRPSS